jgi:hypothetical protein
MYTRQTVKSKNKVKGNQQKDLLVENATMLVVHKKAQ